MVDAGAYENSKHSPNDVLAARIRSPMVKKLILAVKEGEFPVVGYFAGLPFLLSSSHAQHSIEEGGADSSRSSVGMVIKCPHAR